MSKRKSFQVTPGQQEFGQIGYYIQKKRHATHSAAQFSLLPANSAWFSFHWKREKKKHTHVP